MISILRQICCDEAGATAVEYGLIVALIVIAMISALSGVANESNSMWDNISSKYADAADRAGA